MGSSVLESRSLVTTLYFINVLQSMLPGGGGDQAGLLSLIDNRGTEGSRGHVPCSRSPAAPCCCYGNSGCWEHGAGRTDGSLETTSGGSPGAPSRPPAQEPWRVGEDWAHCLSKGLFPPGSHKSHVPSWASSAGINTIKGMFSLPPGFTMCWERKNKSFIPTRRIEWRQNFPSKARKSPPAFQKRRRPR